LLYFTTKHRSLSGVEIEISQVEYFIDYSSTRLALGLALLSSLTRAVFKQQSAREEKNAWLSISISY